MIKKEISENFLMLYLFIILLIALVWIFASKRAPCPSFFSWLIEKENPFAKENRSSTILKRLELNKGMHVIDIGCGPGRVTIPLAKALMPDGEVTAFDTQAAMLEKVKNKARGCNNIIYLKASAGSGKLKKNSYNRALLINVLGELPNKEEVFNEIFRSLKPEGSLCITETIFDPHYQKQSRVISLAKEAGFKLLKTYGSWHSYSLTFSAKK